MTSTWTTSINDGMRRDRTALHGRYSYRYNDRCITSTTSIDDGMKKRPNNATCRQPLARVAGVSSIRCTLHGITWHYMALHGITWHYMARDVTPCHAMPLHAMLCHYTSHHITSHYATQRHATPRYVALRCVTLRYTTLHNSGGIAAPLNAEEKGRCSHAAPSLTRRAVAQLLLISNHTTNQKPRNRRRRDTSRASSRAW